MTTTPKHYLKNAAATPDPLDRIAQTIEGQHNAALRSRDYAAGEMTRLRKLARQYAEQGKGSAQYDANKRADQYARIVADWDRAAESRRAELSAFTALRNRVEVSA